MLSLVKSVDYRYIYRSVGMVKLEFVLNAVNDNAYPGNLIYKVRKNHHTYRSAGKLCADHTACVNEQRAVGL